MIKDDKNRIDKSLANHDDYYMSLALKAAYGAQSQDEVPIGAVLVDERGSVIASAGNTTRTRCDPTGHAEVNVLRAAGKLIGNHRLLGCTLFVTLEPCAMCAGAISHARLKRVVIAASDPKGGLHDKHQHIYLFYLGIRHTMAMGLLLPLLQYFDSVFFRKFIGCMEHQARLLVYQPLKSTDNSRS